MQTISLSPSVRRAMLEISGRLLLTYRQRATAAIPDPARPPDGPDGITPFSPSSVTRVTPGLKQAVASGFIEGVEPDPRTGKPRRWQITVLGWIALGVDATHADFIAVWRRSALDRRR